MTDRIRIVRLYGTLGARFGRVHRLVVNSAAEAVRALSVQLPGFERFFYEAKDRGVVFAVFHGRRNIGKDELGYPPGRSEIRIAPVIAGSKRAGMMQTVIGVALIAVATLATAGVAGAGFAGIGAGGVWGTVGTLGISLAIGGVAQMAAGTPKGLGTSERPDNQPSYTFNGPVNTVGQGGPVPLAYGRMIVGSFVISSGIYSEDKT